MKSRIPHGLSQPGAPPRTQVKAVSISRPSNMRERRKLSQEVPQISQPERLPPLALVPKNRCEGRKEGMGGVCVCVRKVPAGASSAPQCHPSCWDQVM